MFWNYKKGDFVTFNTVQSDLVHLNGRDFEVIRRLTDEEADLCETGPMYKIGIDGYEAGKERLVIDAFEDEISLNACGRFLRMTELYKALGYRIVAFERKCEGGWIMAFDTRGKDATELPKEAYDIQAVRNWCKWCGWPSVTDDDVLIFDETDDPWFIFSAYDYEAELPVMQLASDWQ